MDVVIDPALRRRLVGAFGQAGRVFVDDVHQLVGTLSEEWGIVPAEQLPASYAVVVAGRRGGDEVVLKLRVPNREADTEADLLEWYAGDGAAPLLAADGSRGALLLPRLRPGSDLRDLDDGAATQVIADLIESLTRSRDRPLPGDLPTVRDWSAGFTRSGLRGEAISAARTLYDELVESSSEATVLHGDLHHTNVLRDGRGWCAIDPQGVIGERGYEVGAFVRNPLREIAAAPDARARVVRRLDVLAERLGEDRARLHGWSYAQAVLAACWDAEEGSDPTGSLRIAEVIGHP